jgi:hypothetical protein
MTNPEPSASKKSTVMWCVWSLLVIAAIYRLVTFVAQPLDSPGTLRPHLYAWFSAFLKHYPSPGQAQNAWNGDCLRLLLVAPALVLFNYFSVSMPRNRLRQFLCSQTLLFVSIAVALLACRLPILLLDQLNPDESHFVAAARKLLVDPIFYRSIDCGTSGPFNVFPLILPAIFGFSPDFVSTRVIGMMIIIASIYSLYRAFRLVVSDRQARVAILPVAGAFAVLKNSDFLHYSSEHVSFLLLSLAMFLCVKVFTQPERYAINLFGLGLLASTAFFAKMQAVPIVFVVGVVAIVFIYRTAANAAGWWRPAAMFVAGGALLQAINAALCLSTGVWHDFWMSYIAGNYSYSQVASQNLEGFVNLVLSIWEMRMFIVTLVTILVVHAYSRTLREQLGSLSLYLKLCVIAGITALASDYVFRSFTGSTGFIYVIEFCIFAFLASLLFMLQNDRRGVVIKWFGWLIAVVLAAALFAAYAPHRLFIHYLLLLVIPFNVALSWPIFARCSADESGLEEAPGPVLGSPGLPFTLVFVTLTVTCQIVLQGIPVDIKFGAIGPEIHRPDSDFIRSMTEPSGQIVVWGWNTDPYLGSGRVPATRDLDMTSSFGLDPTVTAFYHDRFLRDMRRTPPQMLVDAVGPASFPGDGGRFRDRATGGFELIPEIKSFIDLAYVNVAEGYEERFYMRRDLLAGDHDRLRKCDPEAIRCFEGTARTSPADLPPIRMPDHAVLDIVLVSDTKQDLYATVFGNDTGANEHAGFTLVNMGGDFYQMAAGVGGQWVRSKPILLPRKIPVALSFEFERTSIAIFCNGVKLEQMQLPGPMTDTSAPISIGSWLSGQRVFAGKIEVFQIVPAGRRPAMARR